MKVEILELMQRLFGDTSATKTETLEQLEEIRDQASSYIECLNDDGVFD